MTVHDHALWRHSHVFDGGNLQAERNTRWVMIITLVMMVVEIAAGWIFNSMALLADGWHMSSHAFAIGLSSLAYWASRRYATDPRFAFGAWKIEVLAGYTSGLFLLGVAALMVYGSVERLLAPQSIHFQEAILVAVIGLVVNLVCAMILGQSHDHGHDHHHDHGHGHDHDHHHDLNLKSAYLHVIADAATSVLAIVALVAGMAWGWNWLDPVMGLVGAVLVAVWAWGLMQETGRVLLDCEMNHPVVEEVREVIRDHPAWSAVVEIADLHVWRVGKAQYAVVLGLVVHGDSPTPDEVRQALSIHEELVHISVEINRCNAPSTLP